MTMEKSMKLGAELIEQVWERTNPKEFTRLRQAPKERILVVKGIYDNIEKILANAKVPHTKLDAFPDRDELQQGGKYHDSKVLFVNCDTSYHRKLEKMNISKQNKPALKDFVARGGRIVTTDWAQTVVQYLFGKISAKTNVTDDECVKVQFASEIGRELSGITYGNATPNWWLEYSSDIIQYKKGSGIVSLVESEELQEKYGSRHIALGFPYEHGEVFHFVSHLIAQKLKNYDSRDKQCLNTFLDATGTSLKSGKKSKLTFGEIETTYTLMYTVLELCLDKTILPRGGTK